MNQVNEEFHAQFQNDAEFERINRQFQAEVVPGSEADIKKFGEGFVWLNDSGQTYKGDNFVPFGGPKPPFERPAQA